MKTDFKRKPVLDRAKIVQPYLDEINDEDAKRYGYQIEVRKKATYYYHDSKDPYRDIYNYNEESMKLAKLLCNCLVDMQRAIEIDYGVNGNEIREKQTLGPKKKDIAWYNYWLKLDQDAERLDNCIMLAENALLENNKNPINADARIEVLTEKYNIAFEYTRFMPVGFIAYDPKKDEILNVSPNELTFKKVKQMIKELKEAEKSDEE